MAKTFRWKPLDNTQSGKSEPLNQRQSESALTMLTLTTQHSQT